MNKTIFLGLLVILMVFSFTNCDNGSGGGGGGGGGGGSGKSGGGGKLTINNIPEIYNDNYAHFISYHEATGGEIWGAQSVSRSAITLVQIKNGNVVLPTWKIAYSGQWSNYFGNDYVNNGKLLIFSTKTVNHDTLIKMSDLASFSFINGSATISAK